jgi:predicted aspartyl protease
MRPQIRFSRRQWIGCGGAALVMAPFSASLATPDAPSGDALSTSDSGHSLLTVDVLLNNRGPYRFVVDTGADRTVIADRVVRDLALPGGGVVRVQGIVRNMDTETARIDSLRAGPVRREGLTLPVLPYEQLQVDGYLGLDILDGYRVSFDFRQGLLRLLDPRPVQALGPDMPREVPIRMSGSDGHLRSTDCIVDGVHCVAFVDTGAEISVGNERLLQRLRENDKAFGLTQSIALTGVTGGVVDGNVVPIKVMRLGELKFEDSAIAIADLQVFHLWGLQDRPCLFIGMNWLRRFNRVAIDYGRKELRFDLATAGREKPLRNCAPGEDGCRYLLGSPRTIPRPSVAT